MRRVEKVEDLPEDKFTEYLPLATREVDFCVPSVVARVGDAGGERWLVGAEAAAQHPGEGVRGGSHSYPG